MNILILGGTGIISTEIVNLLVEQNEVTIVNRGLRKNFINPRAKLICVDMKKETCSQISKKIVSNYDVVIDFLSYRVEELSKFLDIFSNKCKQYVFISSATVYDTKSSKYKESDSCGASNWKYAIDKYKCERFLIEKAHEFHIQYTIIRPYITYGMSRIPLQVAPLKYYTIVYRMKNNKCIPLFGNNVVCTLTTSKDFAVGAVGLIGNEKAFDNIYHIVGDYVTTWEKSLIEIGSAFGYAPDIIKLSKDDIENRISCKGIDVQEVLEDKGRSMIFDNSKIKEVVPEFKGNTRLDEELPKIVDFFSKDKNNRKIDYAWDGRLDHLLIKSSLLTKEQKRRLKLYPSDETGIVDMLTYYCNRYELLFIISKIINKLFR